MKAFSRSSSQRGQSMIEMAVLLPFLFIFLFAIFEWGQIFIKHMRASSICRECALTASMSCKDIDPINAVVSRYQCLVSVQTEMMAKASYVFPDFQNRGGIILSLHGASEASTSPSGIYTTRYMPASIDPAMMNALGTVAMCELFYDNALLTPIERLFSFVMPRLIYKTTYA